MIQAILQQDIIDKTRFSIFLIWLFTISGMIGIYIGMADWFLPKTPLNLMVGLGLLIWNLPAKNGLKSIIIWSIAFLIGIGVEVLGVNFGLFFGEYYYGENLGLKVFGVPLIIGVNWIVLTSLTAYLSKQLISNKWISCIVAAALMVSLDFFIEPIAPLFDFWYWELGHAPLQNFIAWFVIAFLLQVLVYDEVADRKSVFPYHHFASQLLFFGFFYVLYQF